MGRPSAAPPGTILAQDLTFEALTNGGLSGHVSSGVSLRCGFSGDPPNINYNGEFSVVLGGVGYQARVLIGPLRRAEPGTFTANGQVMVDFGDFFVTVDLETRGGEGWQARSGSITLNGDLTSGTLDLTLGSYPNPQLPPDTRVTGSWRCG